MQYHQELTQKNTTQPKQNDSSILDTQFKSSSLDKIISKIPENGSDFIAIIRDNMYGQGNLHFQPGVILENGQEVSLQLNTLDIIAHLAEHPKDVALQRYFLIEHRDQYITLILNGSSDEIQKLCDIYQKSDSQLCWHLLNRIKNFHDDESIRTKVTDILKDHPLQLTTINLYEMIIATQRSKEKEALLDASNQMDNHLFSPLKDATEYFNLLNFIKDLHLLTAPQYIGIEHLVLEDMKKTKTDHSTGMGLRIQSASKTLASLKNNPIFAELKKSFFDFKTEAFGVSSFTVLPIKIFATLNNGEQYIVTSNYLTPFGKGLSKDAAKASLAMEFIERFCAQFGSSITLIPRTKIREYALSRYVTQRTILYGKATDLEQQEKHPIDINNLNHVLLPEGINPNEELLHWTQGKSLLEDNADCLLPASLVFCSTYFPESNLFAQDSTGLSAGNTTKEAILQGALEIIERYDACSSFYREDRVFLLDAKNNALKKFEKRMQRYIPNFRVQFFEMTQGFGIPSYAAFVNFKGCSFSGYGTHFNGEIAINRALGELISNIVNYLIINEDVVFEKPKETIQTRTHLPNYSSGSIDGDLTLLKKLLRVNNLNLYYADLTTTEFNIPVIRSIIPKLNIPSTLTAQQLQNIANIKKGI